MEKLNLRQSELHFQKSLNLVPGGVQGVRRPYNYVPGEYPVFLSSAKGGRITDLDGNEYVDMLCAYGPIIIGYREEEIDMAVIEQIQQGGFCMSLTQPVQTQLAEKLRQVIPCCEKVLFAKSGSDATTAAVRIARGYTGRRKVLRCGYHGWHDWCVEDKGGIPAKLYEDVFGFAYNDLDQLEDLMKAHDPEVAAIIITPVGHPLAQEVQMPKPGFLEGVRDLSSKHGTVLIFDEIRSGFRVSMGGAQKRFNVTPDIALFGKAMANGYPISAVAGKAKIMDVLADGRVFISSTFFGNSLEQVASLKTIELLERHSMLDAIEKKGEEFGRRISHLIEDSGMPCTLTGIPWMPCITFKKDPDKLYKMLRKEFHTCMIRQQVFMAPYHHCYIAFRHTKEDLDLVVDAVANAFDHLKTRIEL
ncbi:MAG: aminotransferase class III-fold pyridoxal phosphate-dependent enzyme [Candidatus Aminicenantes bacterium]|nr:aminotransferase class III-fold pyridoxal phosphate-dependent enzyme [Candidatus Aminicenantes bacterium]